MKRSAKFYTGRPSDLHEFSRRQQSLISFETEGSLSLFVDFYSANVATKRDSYLITRTDKCIINLEGMIMLSILDADGDYNKARVEKTNCKKISITSHH